MVLLSKQHLDEISLMRNHTPAIYSGVPIVDLSKPSSKSLLVKAFEEVGFFKVTNPGVPLGFMDRLEADAVKFFCLPQHEKEHAALAYPFGYGNKQIGSRGDVGWVECLLLPTNVESVSQISFGAFNQEIFCSAANEYISSVKKLACNVLEVMEDGLKIRPRDMFSKLLDEESDSLFRINHYPRRPEVQNMDCNLTGFGEHTDPQII